MTQAGPQALLSELERLERLRDPKVIKGKRQFSRFVVRGEADLMEMDAAGMQREAVPVLLRDLGQGGIGFVSPTDLDTNSTWRASFVQQRYVIGQQALVVRHCRMIHGGVYLVGAQFCAEAGLMCLLGVDPGVLRQSDGGAGLDDQSAFLPPGEVA